MGATFPSFNDRFLERVARAFERRRRAIAYQNGTFEAESILEQRSEVLVVSTVRGAPKSDLILELGAKNHLSLWLRSNLKPRRGKVVLRVEKLRVISNAKRIVETYEWTLAESYRLDDPNSDNESICARIVERWQTLAIKVVD
jgi:hypothetical protein